MGRRDRSFNDSGYDCSGPVSYALAGAGLLQVPMSSSEPLHYAKHGRGKWITVYARNGHAFAIIAGLRLDTTACNNRSDRDAPRWHPANRPRADSKCTILRDCSGGHRQRLQLRPEKGPAANGEPRRPSSFGGFGDDQLI